MKTNEEKRAKFIECAGKRVNNVLHDMQILEPMARSSVYDFTKEDIEEMFTAMQETLDNVKAEFYKKFEEKVRSEKKVFSFGNKATTTSGENVSEVAAVETISEATPAQAEAVTLNTSVAEEVIENPVADIPEITEDLAAVAPADNNLIF